MLPILDHLAMLVMVRGEAIYGIMRTIVMCSS